MLEPDASAADEDMLRVARQDARRQRRRLETDPLLTKLRGVQIAVADGAVDAAGDGALADVSDAGERARDAAFEDAIRRAVASDGRARRATCPDARVRSAVGELEPRLAPRSWLCDLAAATGI